MESWEDKVIHVETFPDLWLLFDRSESGQPIEEELTCWLETSINVNGAYRDTFGPIICASSTLWMPMVEEDDS